MRRWMLSLFMVGTMISMIGCHCVCTRGVCDCEDEDHCYNRSPWVRFAGHGPETAPAPAPTVEVLPAPKDSKTDKKPL